jgi:MFS family permease
MTGARDRARRVLARIGGEAYAASAITDVEVALEAERASTGGWRALLAPRISRIVLVGVLLAVLQQWSGINTIFNYAEEIYRKAGYGLSDVMFNIVITGAINLAFTLVAIATVDRLGRRKLMLAGCAGIGLSHLLLGTAYALHLQGGLVLALTLCSLGCYAVSLAPVTWVLIAEIFPNRIRGAAVSVAVSALWIACFILTFAFPLLQAAVGMAGTFWLYAIICLAGFGFVLRQVPETRGKSLEDIERELTGGHEADAACYD